MYDRRYWIQNEQRYHLWIIRIIFKHIVKMANGRLIFVALVGVSLPALCVWFLYSQSIDTSQTYSPYIQGKSLSDEDIMKQSRQQIELRNQTLATGKTNRTNKTDTLTFSSFANSGGDIGLLKKREKILFKTVRQIGTVVANVTRTKSKIRYDLVHDNVMTTYNFPLDHVKFSQGHTIYKTYEEALRGQTKGQLVKSEKTVILAVVDLGYIDLAINLYMSSFLKHRLYDYLFICSEGTACDILNAIDITAFSYVDYSKIGKTASSYFSEQFRAKTHVKTMAILDALNLNYNVLITDVDIVFLKNPFDHMPFDNCDIQITSDELEGNSGFYFARNTPAAKALHQGAMEMHEKHPELSNQKTVDRTMERMSKEGQLKYHMLDVDEFPNGLHYYETGHRMWRTDFPCTKCVIVHNNWIVSKNAKINRFKEHHHWFVDKNEYYSSLDTNYITYSNPGTLQNNRELEYDALRSAFWIAHALNRTLILPQFHKPSDCQYTVCQGHNFGPFSLNYHVQSLDKYLGEEMYRESSFLVNRLVPQEVRNSEVKIVIESDVSMNLLKSPKSHHIFRAENLHQGAKLEEIKQWFGSLNSKRVLNFHSLYGAVDLEDAARTDVAFAQKLVNGIKSSDYRQYKNTTVVFGWMAAKTQSGFTMMLIIIPVFVIPLLCLTVCYKTGVCDMEEIEEYEQRVKSIRKYRKVLRKK